MFFLHFKPVNVFIVIFMNNDEEARFAVTPSFVLTHSSDSI